MLNYLIWQIIYIFYRVGPKVKTSHQDTEYCHVSNDCMFRVFKVSMKARSMFSNVIMNLKKDYKIIPVT